MNSTEMIKIIMLGHVSSGKTSIFRQYFDKQYSEDAISTINSDFRVKQIALNNKLKVTLVVYDTSGQEKYYSITKNYYQKTDGVMLVFDVTDKMSFDRVAFWSKAIKENGLQNCPGILIGNKIDSKQKVIHFNEGEKIALQLGFPYMEVSSKMNINIKEAFLYLGQLIYRKKILKKEGKDKEWELLDDYELSKKMSNSKNGC